MMQFPSTQNIAEEIVSVGSLLIFNKYLLQIVTRNYLHQWGLILQGFSIQAPSLDKNFSSKFCNFTGILNSFLQISTIFLKLIITFLQLSVQNLILRPQKIFSDIPEGNNDHCDLNYEKGLNWGNLFFVLEVPDFEPAMLTPALPYFDNSVAVPDVLKKAYFDFDSRTPSSPPQKKEN